MSWQQQRVSMLLVILLMGTSIALRRLPPPAPLGGKCKKFRWKRDELIMKTCRIFKAFRCLFIYYFAWSFIYSVVSFIVWLFVNLFVYYYTCMYLFTYLFILRISTSFAGVIRFVVDWWPHHIYHRLHCCTCIVLLYLPPLCRLVFVLPCLLCILFLLPVRWMHCTALHCFAIHVPRRMPFLWSTRCSAATPHYNCLFPANKPEGFRKYGGGGRGAKRRPLTKCLFLCGVLLSCVCIVSSSFNFVVSI